MTDKYFYITHKTFPLYRGLLVITITNDLEKLAEYDSYFKDHPIVYAHTVGNHEYKGKQAFQIILNPDSSKRKLYHSTIAHEAIHAANLLLDARGVVITQNNDEPLTYLVDWIIDEVYKYLRKLNLYDKIK